MKKIIDNFNKMTTAIDATVIFHINGFEQKPPCYFKTYQVPSANDIVMPFLQSYKYRVKSIFDNWNVFNIHLEPFCDTAKKVFESQYCNK